MTPDEIRRRIEEVKQQRLTTLDLSNDDHGWNTPNENKLSAIPPEVFELVWLETLNLSYNQLTSLPDSVTLLQNLSQLDLRENQLTSLPDSVTLLQNLSRLDLSFNKLTSLPDSIGNLQNLSELNLSDNQLTSLPDSIGNLQNLSELNLSGNQLTSLPDSITLLQNLSQLKKFKLNRLPDSIGNLQNLSQLYLSDNQLTSLPDSIGNLQNLSQLNLSDNQLTSLPDSVTRLQNLFQLDLSRNQLTSLPDSVTRLQNLFRLDLSRNPLKNPPIEIAERGIKAIREYFRNLEEETKDTLYEAKLIIIGEGGAGKTTLARKIKQADSPLPKADESTHGIDVQEWHFSMENNEDFRVNIWDFGGQEIYHATHQFFLTKRSLYLLVVDNRKEHPHLDYWLNIVELFSENSPILIIKNQVANRSVEIDETQLKGRFNNFKETIGTNLGQPLGGSGLKDIMKAIIYHIQKLPHIGSKFSKTWIQIRTALEEDNRNYISLEEYLNICEQNGFTLSQQSNTDGRLILSQYLHDIGVILHFQEDKTSLLYKTIILKPQWGTDAAYKVLDNPTVKQNSGKFTQTDINEIWQDSQYNNMQGELLELMKKFKLCYPLPNNNNTYIAPQLLDSNQPEYDWNSEQNLLLRYEYDFMPKGILTRFIVDMHRHIDEPKVWRSGVILKRDNTLAEIIETYDRREIRIRLSGKNKRGLLEIITDKLDEIHDSFKRLRVKKLIPCNCSVCKDNPEPNFYDYKDLRGMIDYNIQIDRCKKPPYNEVEIFSLIDDTIGREKFLQQKDRENREHSGVTIEGNVYGNLTFQQTTNGKNIMETKPIIKSAWANGSFYLFVFVVVVAGIGFLGKQLSFPILLLVIIAGVLFIPIIGALQLKQDDRVKDETFLKLMGMVINQLPLIGKFFSSKK